MIFPYSPKIGTKNTPMGLQVKNTVPQMRQSSVAQKYTNRTERLFPPEQAHPPPSRWTRRNTEKGNSVHFDTYMGALNQPRWLNITPRSHFCQRDLSPCHNFCTSYLFFILFFGIFARYKTTFFCFFGLQM